MKKSKYNKNNKIINSKIVIYLEKNFKPSKEDIGSKSGRTGSIIFDEKIYDFIAKNKQLMIQDMNDMLKKDNIHILAIDTPDPKYKAWYDMCVSYECFQQKYDLIINFKCSIGNSPDNVSGGVGLLAYLLIGDLRMANDIKREDQLNELMSSFTPTIDILSKGRDYYIMEFIKNTDPNTCDAYSSIGFGSVFGGGLITNPAQPFPGLQMKMKNNKNQKTYTPTQIIRKALKLIKSYNNKKYEKIKSSNIAIKKCKNNIRLNPQCKEPECPT